MDLAFSDRLLFVSFAAVPPSAYTHSALPGLKAHHDLEAFCSNSVATDADTQWGLARMCPLPRGRNTTSEVSGGLTPQLPKNASMS